ncbi:SixA phosphatase family protein [Sphingomonas sp. DT-204]|uniref:SixA phosphatase family protein n=1 Tax=Sphingomonas sp. DT-204 TaxID=3396166 RepID=UPI003F1A12B0
MKTLTLLRHAKSSWDDPVARDFDRPLNAKGHRAAVAIGHSLRSLGLGFDHVVASPAVRVTETLEGVEEGYGRDLTLAWDRRLYLASPSTLLDVIHELPDSAGRVMLVGHNPGLEELVLLLVPDGAGDALRGEVETKFPTGSVAVLTFEIDRWADARPGEATLTRFVRPRDLDPSLGPGRD